LAVGPPMAADTLFAASSVSAKFRLALAAAATMVARHTAPSTLRPFELELVRLITPLVLLFIVEAMGFPSP
jgi:hypothetical protein